MPTPRLPVAKIQAKGSHIKNPKLFAGRREPKTVPLGAPSPHMKAMQRTAWEAFKLEIPWLAESDRAVMEAACIIRAKVLEGQELGDKGLTAYRQYLTCLGGTPADRSRIVVAEEESADPTESYFQ